MARLVTIPEPGFRACALAAMSVVAALTLSATLAAGAGKGQQPTATIGARDGELLLVGARVLAGDRDSIALVDGPISALQGLEAAGDGETEVTFALDQSIGRRATLTFWMCPRQWFGNGEDRETVRYEPIQIPGMGEVVFEQAPDACLFLWDWDRSMVEGVSGIGNYFPELPGPEWYHVLVTWDARQGWLDLYINGTPQRVPQLQVEPWMMPPSPEITLRLGAFRLADLRIGRYYVSPADVPAYVPASYLGRHAELLGAPGKQKPIDVRDRLGRLLYQSRLGSEEDIDGWVMEGPGVVRFVDGWMQMSSALVDGRPRGHIVHWCLQDFPDSFVAEWEVRVVSKAGLNIVFFAAKGEHGEDIFDPQLPTRNGVFSGYTRGAIVSYHISYYANTRITSNLRKNNQFYLVANGPPGIGHDDKRPHRVRLVKDGAHIQLLVDGRVIIDFVDDGKRYGPVHDGGKIGFRQMSPTTARYRNLRVWELNSP